MDPGFSLDPAVGSVDAASEAAIIQGQQNTLSADSSAKVSGSDSYGSWAQFAAQQPQLAQAMLQSIAQQICQQSQDENDQLIQTIKEGEDQE